MWPSFVCCLGLTQFDAIRFVSFRLDALFYAGPESMMGSMFSVSLTTRTNQNAVRMHIHCNAGEMECC